MGLRRFYRYLSLADDDRRQWAQECVANSTVYFARPSSFNDPFEFAYRVDIRATRDQWRAFLATVDARTWLNLPAAFAATDRNVDLIIDRVAQRAPPVLSAIRTKLLDETVVCCLSSSRSHALLWGHYADGHRGICLQFTQQSAGSLFGTAERVVYSRDVPTISLPDLDYAAAGRSIALTKASPWRYEREWRMVQSDLPPGARVYQPGELTGVVFGCRVAAADVALVRTWLDGRGVRLFQASAHPHRYHLSVAPFAP